ncbi:hypothetical protein [Undibacterium squillarum]|uniref:hypothetical protein n=1 Tax=Undibacterium squillarum TaxID=1131567 RepID=UPI0035B14879
MNEGLVETVAAAIRRYLEIRPGAVDTLEGIHHFWVDWGGREESMAITAQALQRLEEQGFLEQKKIGPRALWRLRKS